MPELKPPTPEQRLEALERALGKFHAKDLDAWLEIIVARDADTAANSGDAGDTGA